MRYKGTNQAKPNTILEVEKPQELLPFLLEKMAHRSRNSVKGILSRGQVFINERSITRHDHQLEPGDQVVIRWGTVLPKKTGVEIIYEDDDVIIINKRAGLLTIASLKEKEFTAYRHLTSYVREKNPNDRIFIVHRLDRDTSGVMMFAKNERAKERLQNSWKNMVKERSYIALVEGKVTKKQDTIVSWFKETKTHRMYSSRKVNDGQKAVTHYKVLQANARFSLLEVRLDTGRKNQIRVHMQDIGHPIVGDKLYGSTQNPIGRLGLHAALLAFRHPTTNKILSFTAEAPDAFDRLFKKQ
ncbi:23S rRNA pseudouridine1911/1915/1917 synthase [Pullulanibacillus pueri]|uniref:Pseudouridine synthase n=1 Tax=Pullulanibacillus pueri TaxID=1437324 RepID=A0A8J3ELB1_9BACL|nr:RluA family pseudouridine synthase [Pullulanibacillus pueri]MBM7680771.1 23S rRNA pseudouridine1911/1915/1917 synthase [Pullulanibacillus pueri]GGH78267.1 pseudouridine synthase [Pullulanibacillus pueri]